ncbi:MAG: NHL repeat-containing protein [Planctomycetota bacterium]|jgi:outer membrane protein assembly factor BamB
MALAVAVDGDDSLYVSGITEGKLAGEGQEDMDVFLARYDAQGRELWLRQFGSSLQDCAADIAVNSRGECYVAGYGGSRDEQTNIFTCKASFIAKYDAQGDCLWLRDFAQGHRAMPATVAVDDQGYLYVIGWWGPVDSEGKLTSSAFVARFDGDGRTEWARGLAPDGLSMATGIVPHPDGSYTITADPSGKLAETPQGGRAAVLAKYSKDGKLLWSRRLGTDGEGLYTMPSAVLGTDGHYYIAGRAKGSWVNKGRGRRDIFVMKADADGQPLWQREFGTPDDDIDFDHVVDARGNFYITGIHCEEITQEGIGPADIMLLKYDSSGKLVWHWRYGTEGDNTSQDIAIDSSGDILIVGKTATDLCGPNQGGDDAFIMKLRETPASANGAKDE